MATAVLSRVSTTQIPYAGSKRLIIATKALQPTQRVAQKQVWGQTPLKSRFLGATLSANQCTVTNPRGCRKAVKRGIVRAAASQEDKFQTFSTADYRQWDKITTSLTASSTIAFLFFTVPQILKNVQNLRIGNLAPIAILPWMGYTTGLLGNTLLLSYFAGKKELSATAVQGCGVISTYVLLATIYLGGYMPQPAFIIVSTTTALGLSFNLLNYLNLLPGALWKAWIDIGGIVGLAVLPQVIYSTFSKTQGTLPGKVAGALGILFVLLSRAGALPQKVANAWASLSGWTATLLFMFMPVAQLWSNFANPASLKGISLLTVLLGLVGNGLMIPRALFTRDVIWFTGSSWGCLLQGWGCLLSMFIYDAIDKSLFWGITATLAVYLGVVLSKDAKAHGLSFPLTSLGQLLSGRW